MTATSSRQIGCISDYPYYRITVLPYYRITVLLCYRVTVLPWFRVTVVLWYQYLSFYRFFLVAKYESSITKNLGFRKYRSLIP